MVGCVLVADGLGKPPPASLRRKAYAGKPRRQAQRPPICLADPKFLHSLSGRVPDWQMLLSYAAELGNSDR